MTAASSQLAREITKLDWSQYRPVTGLRCLPAMAIAIALGLYFHQPAAGLIAAGGTLSVGFASFRRLHGSRLLQMMLTSLGMGCAASLGTMAGQGLLPTILGAGALGFIYGLILIFSENVSWIGLQCVIAFLVASAFPAIGWHALLRGCIVAMGGILQTSVVLILSRSTWSLSLSEDIRGCNPEKFLRIFKKTILPTILSQVNHRLPVMRYAIRLSLTLTIAVVASRGLHQLNSYWLPMTTILVLKPDFYRTYSSSLSRVLGTFAGVILASLLTFVLNPNPLILGVLVIVFAWTCFAGQKVNYTLFTCTLTAWIVFLIAIAGLPEITVTANRLLDTALGSLIALASRAIGPRWESVSDPAVMPSSSVIADPKS